jgi:UDP-N-acetylmuramate dehydrogenase
MKWAELLARLEGAGLDARLDAPLQSCTTFQLGGPCRCLVACRSPEQLRAAVGTLAAAGQAFILLGGGSNVLISDEGVDAILVRYADDATGPRRDGAGVEAGGAVALDALARYTMQEGWEGLMCCTGIPGTVGGAIAGNAGAWGRQIGDVVDQVELIDRRGVRRTVGPEGLGFAYRRSQLQQGSEIVVSARFRLAAGDAAALAEERERILGERAARHPDLCVDPCIGSIFKNLEPTSAAGRRQAAGWFLEQAGAKSMRVGGAVVFERHANIIVKRAGCTAQDVFDLAGRMAAAVKARFGIELVREVRYLGRFRGGPDPVPDSYY